MTIRGGGSTAIYTAYTITLFTVLTLFYNVFAALHCLNSSMYAYINCYKVRTLLDLGFMGF